MSLTNEIYTRLDKLQINASVVNLALHSMRDEFIAQHPNYKAYHVNDTEVGWTKLASLIPEGSIVGLCGSSMKIGAAPDKNPVYHLILVAAPQAKNE